MIKNTRLRIQYIAAICFFLLKLSPSSQAQSLSINSSIDTNCMLTISLVDSSNNISSNSAPYFFSIGGINQNSNSLASVDLNISSLYNGIYTIQVIDGNQNYYNSTINVTCGKLTTQPSFFLTDSISQAPSSCNQCNGIGHVEVLNPNSNYLFSWSDGVSTVDTFRHERTNLCPGIYTVVVTDTSTGTQTATSIQVNCNSGTQPQIASCFQSLDVILDHNGLATINTQDLSATLIDTSTTIAYIIPPNNNISTTHQFNCQNIGYQNLALLLIDSFQQTSDTCNILVLVQDTLGSCNGTIGNTNGVYGTTTDASSCSVCDGSYNFIWFIDSLTSSGPPTFAWSDGATTGIRNDLCPDQNYVLSVSDANGNIHTAIVNVGCPTSSCLDSSQISPNLLCPSVYAPVCGCDSVTYINACVAAYEYGLNHWTQGPCSAGNISLTVNTSPASFCDTFNNCNGSANISITGGVPPYNTVWSDTSIIGLNPNNLCAGNYTFTINDAAGNSVSSIVVIGVDDCVWPGDADNNTIANNFDLLAIGLNYGNNGPARALTSTTWEPYAAQDWAGTPAGGLPNRKHSDCNGDGSIDSLDVSAIRLNYGHSYFRSAQTSLSGPTPFYVANTVGEAGDSLFAPIILGSATDSLNSAYGVAFTIHYNPHHIDPNSISVDFGNSWLGNHLISVHKNFDRMGRVEIALSRTDHMPMHGFGTLGRVDFTIKDDVFIGRVVQTDTVLTSFSISDVRLITPYNTEIGTTPQTGTITISRPTVVSPINKNLNIRLFPNPTNGELYILSKAVAIQHIRLFTATGQLVQSIEQNNAYQTSLSTEQLAVGVYFISIQTDKGVYKQKIQVTR